MRQSCFFMPRCVAVALLLSGCADLSGPNLTRGPAVCRESAAEPAPSAAALADSLLVIIPDAALTAEQAARVDGLRSRPWAARIEIARIADDAAELLQPGREFMVGVSPTRSFPLQGQRFSPFSSYLYWSGRVTGEFGEASLAFDHNGVYGGLTSIPRDGAGTTYGIEPIGGGLHAVTCVDGSKVPTD